MQCRIPRIHSTIIWKKWDVDWHEARHGPSRTVNLFSVRPHSAQASKGLDKCLVEFKPFYETLLPENLDTHCREWPAGKASTEGQMLVEANSKPHGIVIYTDDSVTKDRSGWGSQSSVVEGLYTIPVEPTESRHPV